MATQQKRSLGLLVLEQAVQQVCNLAYADARVVLDKDEVRAAIKADFKATPTLKFTLKDLETLVQGDDEGEIPEELTQRFSNVDRILKREMT